MTDIPPLGHHLEICFDVENIKHSVEFYMQLGFRMYSGDIDKGWSTITDGTNYLALFEDEFIQREFGVPVLLNYRGGNIAVISKYLNQKTGFAIEKETLLDDDMGSMIIQDPDGMKFFFDTAPEDERVDDS